MKRFVTVDTVAALGALAWAVTALFVHELNELVDYKAAAAFAMAAFGRWWVQTQRAKPEPLVKPK